MKKCFLMLLIAALMISATATADSRVARLGDRLFLSLADADAQNREEILHVQSAGDYIYYVVRTKEDSFCDSERLMRINSEGDETEIGPARLSGGYPEYHQGYDDMTVYGDHIYFISTDPAAGSYTAHRGEWDGGDPAIEMTYSLCASLYRMDLDGGNLRQLVGDLGNAGAHLAIANDVIALSSAWANGYYVYNYCDFMRYDLDGKLIEEIANTGAERHRFYHREDCEFTCQVSALHTDGENVYASLADSEGDFVSGRLTDMRKPDETMVYEAWFTPSLCTEDGFICLTSDAADAFWFEEFDATVTLQMINPEGADLLAYVPADFLHYDMRLTLLDGMVYITAEDRAVRVPLKGGDVEELIDGAFVVNAAFHPDNYHSSDGE